MDGKALACSHSSVVFHGEDLETIPRSVRDFPGFNGSGSKQTGPIEGSISYDCWYDEDDSDDDNSGPGAYTIKGMALQPGRLVVPEQ